MQVKWEKSLGQCPRSRPIVVDEGLLVAGSKSYIGVLSLDTGNELAELSPTQKKSCPALLHALSERLFLTRFGAGGTGVLDLDTGKITQLEGITELHGRGLVENKWTVGSCGKMYTILTQSDDLYNITAIHFCCCDWEGNVIWQRDAWDYGYQVGIYKCGPHLLGISDSGIALLDPESGDILSKRKLEGGVVSGICIGGADRVWISRKGEGISSIDVPSLEHMHSFHSTEPAGFSNLREHGENLYGSTYSHLYSFSKDLETTNFVADCFLPEGDNRMQSGPCVVGKRLYVGSCNCHLWCIHLADGSIESRLEFRGFLNYDPVYHDGCLYVACNDENIYCIDISDDLS